MASRQRKWGEMMMPETKSRHELMEMLLTVLAVAVILASLMFAADILRPY